MSCRAASGCPLRAPGSFSSRGDRGFTLIEVLVALVIVAFGMAALMGALTSSANTVSYMRDKTFAEWVALNQIATFRLKLTQGQLPQKGHTDGDVDFAGRSWHWRQDVLPTAIQGLMRLDVKVRPKEAKGGEDDGWYVTVSGITGDAMAGPGYPGTLWDSLPANNSPGGNNPGKQLGSGSNNGLGTSSTTGLGNPSNTGLGSSGTGLGGSGGIGNSGGTGVGVGTPNTNTNGTGGNNSGGNFGSPPDTGGN